MKIKLAMWDTATNQAISEWQDAEMIKHDTGFGVHFANSKDITFVPLSGRMWSGHMAAILPGAPDNMVILKIDGAAGACDDFTLVSHEVRFG